MPESKLKIDIRRGKILEQLRLEKKVSVSQLSQTLNATPVTIRNDLSALEKDGYLMRVQGGAVLNPHSDNVSIVVPSPNILHEKEKQSIAAVAVKLIEDGCTLFINSGSTVECIAQELKKKKNLSIVTNSLPIAQMLSGIPTFRVIMLGGEVNAQYSFSYGGDAQEQLSRYQADWVILSVDGVSVRGGITTCHAEEAIINRMMIRGAERTMIAADHTKIGRAGFSRVCECASNIHLVTDNSFQSPELAELEVKGLRITFA